MEQLIRQMLMIKARYIKETRNPRKTKFARTKQLDRMHSIRREFMTIQIRLRDNFFGYIPWGSLNLMCPASGPWCLINTYDFKDEGHYVSFKFLGDNTRYVGEYSFLDNKCGIDNLKLLSKLTNSCTDAELKIVY